MLEALVNIGGENWIHVNVELILINYGTYK